MVMSMHVLKNIDMAFSPTGFSKIFSSFSSISPSLLFNSTRRCISTSPVLEKMRWPKVINRPPRWLPRAKRANFPQRLTGDNQQFITETVHEKYGAPVVIKGVQTFESPLKDVTPLQPVEYQNGLRRTGTLAKKIGVQPMWLKDGTKILTTLLQIPDNHVVRYNPPGTMALRRGRKKFIKLENRNKFGSLVVGAESVDPQGMTKEYCGLFAQAGLAPKKRLTRFLISPEAVLPPGTPLDVNHYRVGDFVDVHGITIQRGFQGVVVRWGFKGQPASHGQTKTHRRPGNIGGGGEKGRVWPGTKLPGHMGGKPRVTRGLKIWRINREYNVMWVSGPAIPGGTNSYVRIHDTLLPLRKPKEPVFFPTYIPKKDENLPVEEYDKEVHRYDEDTITFAVTQEKEVRQIGAKIAKVRK